MLKLCTKPILHQSEKNQTNMPTQLKLNENYDLNWVEQIDTIHTPNYLCQILKLQCISYNFITNQLVGLLGPKNKLMALILVTVIFNICWAKE